MPDDLIFEIVGVNRNTAAWEHSPSSLESLKRYSPVGLPRDIGGLSLMRILCEVSRVSDHAVYMLVVRYYRNA